MQFDNHPDTVHMLLHSFVLNSLDYCKFFFNCLPVRDIRQQQSIKNLATRLFGGLYKYDHAITVLSDQLQGISLTTNHEQMDFTVDILAYKCLHGMALSHLT